MEESENMKITKRLFEDVEDTQAGVTSAEVDNIEVEPIDPTDKPEQIADEVQDQVEAGSEGETTISDTNAQKVAQEIVSAGDDIGAGSAFVVPESIGTDNKITRLLEKALKVSIRNRKMGLKENCNVLLIGLPGSAKTASVYDWAKGKGSDVNLVYVNAKNNDLEAYINGYTLPDKADTDYVKQAYSKNLSELDEPNSVLFLDEYNRQIKPHVRASLLTLINEHYIVGNDPDPRDPEGKKRLKTHTFKNLLFTIACINPAVPTDKGAAPLNDAELSRFAAILDGLDSDPASAADYLNKRFDILIATYPKDDPDYAEILETFLRIQHLGLFIVRHYNFDYDTRDDLNVLYTKQKKMLNQRSLGEILISCGGDVEEMKEWVESFSQFIDRDVEMLLNILDDYDSPSFEELCRAKGIDPNNINGAGQAVTDAAKKKAAAAAAGSAASSITDEEDDEEFTGPTGSGNSGTNANVPIMTPFDVVKEIQDTANSYWN